MLVYTCKNKDCKKYLINGDALCKVISEKGEASLDLETGLYTSNENEPISGQVRCFHCNKHALKKEMLSLDCEKSELLRDLDNIESEIDNLMKIMGGA